VHCFYFEWDVDMYNCFYCSFVFLHASHPLTSPSLTRSQGSLPFEEFTSQLSKARADAASAGDAKSPAQKHRQQQKQKQQQQIESFVSGDMQDEPSRPVIRPLFPGSHAVNVLK
jgi:hypothetical protein